MAPPIVATTTQSLPLCDGTMAGTRNMTRPEEEEKMGPGPGPRTGTRTGTKTEPGSRTGTMIKNGTRTCNKNKKLKFAIALIQQKVDYIGLIWTI